MHTVILPSENLVADLESQLIPEAAQTHFYCPACGKVWAHAISKHTLPRHVFQEQRCTSCGNGSLGAHFSYSSMPESFLRREVLLRKNPLLHPRGVPYSTFEYPEP
jgi:predicted RNA-binding Zn-ribbon protein involved in translation (DUF1610 family)